MMLCLLDYGLVSTTRCDYNTQLYFLYSFYSVQLDIQGVKAIPCVLSTCLLIFVHE